ncbi:MAG: metal-dependent transcriptional regulator [Salinispira sp.]
MALMEYREILQSFPAASDYLAAMYLIRRDDGIITNSRIASWLKVSRPAVSQAVKRLKILGYLSQERYGDIALTKDGEDFAVKMLRRHYLLEHFLLKNLNMTWDEIDEEAKHLQNNISDKFAEKMYEVLGRPQTCPHGNPIPGSPGEQKILNAPSIQLLKPQDTFILMRISEEGEETEGLLSFIYENNIKLGDCFTVIQRTERGIELSAEDKQRILIPAGYTPHLRYTMQ